MQKKKTKKLRNREKQAVDQLQKILNVKGSTELFLTSLRHRSYRTRGNRPTYERLEFLGDAVLELVISEYLYTNYSSYSEGDLTRIRAACVNTRNLSFISRKLRYDKLLLLSPSEERSGGRNKNSLLADVFESTLGALYVHSGLSACKKFVKQVMKERIKQIVAKRLDRDPKTTLQEIVQRKMHVTPFYRLKKAVGPDHNRKFEMSLVIGDKTFSTGKGNSKQEAEEDAAQKALEKLGKDKVQ